MTRPRGKSRAAQPEPALKPFLLTYFEPEILGADTRKRSEHDLFLEYSKLVRMVHCLKTN